MGHHTGHYFLAVLHQATEKQNATNSLLSQHSGSLVAIRPGNSSYVSMTAQPYFCVLLDIERPGLGGSTTVNDQPVTHTNTPTHVCAFANTRSYTLQSCDKRVEKIATFICN